MARCVVQVVGMADRMKGVSKKTQNPYDMVEVAISYKNQWGKNAVACATVDGPVCDDIGVHVGGKFDAVVNQYNGRTYLDIIDEVK